MNTLFLLLKTRPNAINLKSVFFCPNR